MGLTDHHDLAAVLRNMHRTGYSVRRSIQVIVFGDCHIHAGSFEVLHQRKSQGLCTWPAELSTAELNQ